MKPSSSPRAPRGYGGCFTDADYEELVVPAIWEEQTFVDKAGPAIVNTMYTFADKANRPVCLVPEITALIQERWRDDWSRREPRPMRVFYVARCYRYDRPQRGRYREFTQIGVELLGGRAPDDRREVEELLVAILDDLGVRYTFDRAVQRGLAYYVEDGFEARCAALGAQQQIAGGGRYAEGIGWAIGLDRLVLALTGVQDPP
jgi:histidyl-tRNA synthetase